jgi:hypothetical protein
LAKIVLVCLRNPSAEASARVQHALQGFLDSLCPDNLVPADPIVTSDGHGLHLGVFNPAEPAAIHDCSAYVGWLKYAARTWWLPGGPAPTGSFALLRAGASSVEALTDFAASRTVWIAHTDEVFIASTSQRAVPLFLGSFETNPHAIAWMLSAGTLGPSSGWDRRARPLAPGGSARLDRARWTLTFREPPIKFRAEAVADQVHAERLRRALTGTLEDLRLDWSRWVLPLSGGFDSRAILLLMKERRGLRTVTWGRREAIDLPGNDAHVARRVAAAVGVEHRYYSTDLSGEPVERLLDRYLIAGDGRTAGFLPYMDGFETWRSLYAGGVRGVIRGDHGFGPGPAPPFAGETDVLHFNSMPRWRDHAGLPPLAQFGLPELDEQPWPESFDRLESESLADWRDRLYQAYRIPCYHAGQSDLKATYVEIASPLFVREIVELTRTHPEHLRNGKRLFTEVVAPHDVPVAYAVDSALVPPRSLMANRPFAELLCDELGSLRFRNAFTGEFADFLLASFSAPRPQAPIRGLLEAPRRHLRRLVPAHVRSRLRKAPKRKSLDLNWVALRAYIASRMLERMSDDARVGRGPLPVERPARAVALMSTPAALPSQFL